MHFLQAQLDEHFGIKCSIPLISFQSGPLTLSFQFLKRSVKPLRRLVDLGQQFFIIGLKRGAPLEWLELKIAGNKLANLLSIGSVQRTAGSLDLAPLCRRKFKLRRQTVGVLPQYLTYGGIRQYGTW